MVNRSIENTESCRDKDNLVGLKSEELKYIHFFKRSMFSMTNLC